MGAQPGRGGSEGRSPHLLCSELWLRRLLEQPLRAQSWTSFAPVTGNQDEPPGEAAGGEDAAGSFLVRACAHADVCECARVCLYPCECVSTCTHVYKRVAVYVCMCTAPLQATGTVLLSQGRAQPACSSPPVRSPRIEVSDPPRQGSASPHC